MARIGNVEKIRRVLLQMKDASKNTPVDVKNLIFVLDQLGKKGYFDVMSGTYKYMRAIGLSLTLPVYGTMIRHLKR
jgi:hypothetical protein